MRAEHWIVGPDVGAMAERRVEHPALAEGPFPRLRLIAALLNARECFQVAAFGIEAAVLPELGDGKLGVVEALVISACYSSRSATSGFRCAERRAGM